MSQRLRWLLCCAVVLPVAGWLAVRWWSMPAADEAAAQPGRAGPQPARQPRLSPLEQREQEAARTIWARELLAQDCGRTIDSFWDALNASTNKLALASDFPAQQVVPPRWKPPQALAHGIEVRAPEGAESPLSRAQWHEQIESLERAGWQIVRTEFRQNRFDTREDGAPWASVFHFAAHLVNPLRGERAILEGNLRVDWGSGRTRDGLTPVERIDASGVGCKTRRGEPFFELVLSESLTPAEKAYFIDPLILYDLDGDGLSEIVLAVQNVVYRRHGNDRFVAEPLCRHPPGLIFTGLVADFDGDGQADFLCAWPEGLCLFHGSPQGTFDEPARRVWTASPPLKNAMTLTCGDIDEDGDLDVFVGQYRVPSLGQILRPHYYDANDGHPAWLLLNDGQGHFTDATEAAGLAPKRWRRTFGASFVDLNADGHLDLLVTSDFAGVDVYAGDGRGQFTDVTRQWLPETHAFGMSHTVADFDGDGRLDFLVVGMNSPTADRLAHLGLRRPGSADDPAMRRQMTFGNRLFLARPEGGFLQTALNDPIARTGWSWGASAFDLDNDGTLDLYIVNGHQSKESVREYEPEFWLHDIYVDETVPDVMASAYFLDKFARTRARGWSYGGYEKKRLFLRQPGGSFVEVAHLAGVALEEDGRNVVSDDLDGDGRNDLVLTTFEVWPEIRQTLRIYRNVLPETGHWIGFRFREEGPGRSPVGVRVTLRAGGRTAVQQRVTGAGFRSEPAHTVHFGLGTLDRVEEAEMRWTDGRTLRLRNPAVDVYHAIHAPPAREARP